MEFYELLKAALELTAQANEADFQARKAWLEAGEAAFIACRGTQPGQGLYHTHKLQAISLWAQYKAEGAQLAEVAAQLKQAEADLAHTRATVRPNLSKAQELLMRAQKALDGAKVRYDDRTLANNNVRTQARMEDAAAQALYTKCQDWIWSDENCSRRRNIKTQLQQAIKEWDQITNLLVVTWAKYNKCVDLVADEMARGVDAWSASKRAWSQEMLARKETKAARDYEAADANAEAGRICLRLQAISMAAQLEHEFALAQEEAQFVNLEIDELAHEAAQFDNLADFKTYLSLTGERFSEDAQAAVLAQQVLRFAPKPEVSHVAESAPRVTKTQAKKAKKAQREERPSRQTRTRWITDEETGTQIKVHGR